MLFGFDDLDVFKPRRFHMLGHKLRGAMHIRKMFGKRADARDAQKFLQLIQKAGLICFDEGVGGLGHSFIVERRGVE